MTRVARFEGEARPPGLLPRSFGAVTLLAFNLAVGAGQGKPSLRVVEVGGLLPTRCVVALLTVLAKLSAMLIRVA
jgi:hypothetical protein